MCPFRKSPYLFVPNTYYSLQVIIVHANQFGLDHDTDHYHSVSRTYLTLHRAYVQVFVLPPLTADRDVAGKRLLDACLNATKMIGKRQHDVDNPIPLLCDGKPLPQDDGSPPAIILLSVIGAAGSDRPSLKAYGNIEAYLGNCRVLCLPL